MTELEHAGILSSDEVSEESLLGHLVGIVHHQFIAPQEAMKQILEEADMPDHYWPNKPKPIPSFQAACRSLESPKYEEITFRDPQTKMDITFGVEYMIDVLKDGSRQLTRKITYTGNEHASKALEEQLEIFAKTTQKEPEKMAKFQYDHETDTITRTNLYDKDELAIEEQTDKKYNKALEQFNLIRKCYTERYLKDAWFKMLRTEGAIPWLKNCGSLWFIPKNARKYVESFGVVYNKIHGDHGTWRAVPIINTKVHRDCLKEDVQLEYKDRFKAFLENIASKIDRDMDDDKRRELINENREKFESSLQKELVERYNNLLGMSISAKVNDFKVSFESSRLEKAKEYLKNL